MRIQKDGGAFTTLAALPDTISSWSLAVDDATLYWADYYGHSIRKMPKAGGPISVVSSPIGPRAIFLDATSLYWTDWASGSVMRVTPKP
jgi:hypothetical protein